jgi:hypothetical protein
MSIIFRRGEIFEALAQALALLDTRELALGVLRGLAKRGDLVRTGTIRNAQRATAPSLL